MKCTKVKFLLPMLSTEKTCSGLNVINIIANQKDIYGQGLNPSDVFKFQSKIKVIKQITLQEMT